GEHDVSLMSARSVLDALNRQKYAITEIFIDQEGRWWSGDNLLDALTHRQFQPSTPVTILPDPTRPGLFILEESASLTLLSRLDVVFPVLHGTFGEDGTLQGLLELVDVAYVGAGVLASSLGMDKGVFKDVMRARSIPVLESKVFLRSEIEQGVDQVLELAEDIAAYPLFVKPANLGSSVGITKCRSRSDLGEGLFEASRYDRRVLVERGINGREIEVSILGNNQPLASIPGEIIPAGDFYSYEAKYLDEASRLLIPAPLSPELQEQVQKIAVEAYQAIDGAGMARVDFLLDKDTGNLYLNEVNTIPGFTQISMYPKLWEASGVPYQELLDRLIELALERKQERNRSERHYRRQDTHGA
ncbi:MAG TPA: D-alanine--D-alanine ligase family protein, partial [Anaerolineales bacterium]|nr:D-alanine--D-alanine ligase family protein [Anaerolineales bacterium]